MPKPTLKKCHAFTIVLCDTCYNNIVNTKLLELDIKFSSKNTEPKKVQPSFYETSATEKAYCTNCNKNF